MKHTSDKDERIKTIPININNLWGNFIPKNIEDYIESKTSKDVKNRIHKAKYHYQKALDLIDVDPEMACIRFIAAEEELVAAVFIILRRKDFLNKNHLLDFTNNFKNHKIKLAFSQAISQVEYIVEGFFEKNGVKIEGVNDSFHLNFELVEDQFLLFLKSNTNVIKLHPDLPISFNNRYGMELIDKLYDDFESNLKKQNLTSIKVFINERSKLRDDILYADDNAIYSLGSSKDELLNMFNRTIRTLNIALVFVLNDELIKSQVVLLAIQLFIKILIDNNLIKISKE